MTINLKGKIVVNETEDEEKIAEGKYLILIPKSFQVSTLKLYKEDEE